MKQKLLFLTSLLFVFFVHSQERIIGGDDTTINENPWQISIRSSNNYHVVNARNQHICGGSIIAPNWILTAGHCVTNVFNGNVINSNEITISAGITERNDLITGQYRNVVQIIRHPNYSANPLRNDVALIRLDTNLDFNANVGPILLTDSDTHASVGTVARVTGWGNTLDGSNPSPSNILQILNLPIISRSLANSINTDSQTVISTMIPLYKQETGVSRGDSGGPASMVENGSRYLIGCSSWGEFPKDEKPTIYTDLYDFRGWVSNIVPLPSLIGNETVCKTPNITFTLNNEGATSWEVSSNLLIVSSSNNSITVRSKYSSGSIGQITANLTSGISIVKEVQVNNPTLTNNDVFVRDSYYNNLSGSGTSYNPYIVCNGEEYVINMDSNNVNSINYTTISSDWTSYSYGVYEIAFTPNNMNYGNTYAIDVDYAGLCGNSVHTIYFKKDDYCFGGYFTVSPNPSSETLNIAYKISDETNTTFSETGLQSNYKLYDFQSNLVLNGKLDKQVNNINVSALKKGMYILKIYTDKNVETHQIIIN